MRKSYNESPEEEEGENKYKDNSKYIIQIYEDEDNQSISVKIEV